MTFTLKEIIQFLQDEQSMTYSNFSETKRGSPEHAQAVVDKNHEMVQSIRRGASIDEVDYDVKTFVWKCVVFVPVMTRYSGTVSQDEVDGLGLVWLPALRLPKIEEEGEANETYEDEEGDATYAVQILYDAVAQKHIRAGQKSAPPPSNRVHFYIYPEDIIECSSLKDDSDEYNTDSIWSFNDETVISPLTDDDKRILLQKPPAIKGDLECLTHVAETCGIHSKAVGYSNISITDTNSQYVDWGREVTLFGEEDVDDDEEDVIEEE